MVISGGDAFSCERGTPLATPARARACESAAALCRESTMHAAAQNNRLCRAAWRMSNTLVLHSQVPRATWTTQRVQRGGLKGEISGEDAVRRWTFTSASGVYPRTYFAARVVMCVGGVWCGGGGLISKAHTFLHHSTLGSRGMKKTKKVRGGTVRREATPRMDR